MQKQGLSALLALRWRLSIFRDTNRKAKLEPGYERRPKHLPPSAHFRPPAPIGADRGKLIGNVGIRIKSVKIKSLPLFALALLQSLLNIAIAGNPTEAHPWMDATQSADVRTRKLLEAMTLDEKLSLLLGYFGSTIPKDCAPAQPCYIPPADAIDGSAGYVAGIPRLGIPAQFQTDASMGVATSIFGKTKRERTALPATISLASSWNPQLAYDSGAMIGDEARRSGFNVMLAGGVNIVREPRNGRAFEYAGEDPLLAGTIVGKQVAGIQSNHVISTLKHFAINAQETDRHFANAIIDRAAARMADLFAFQIALEISKAGAVMASYNRINGEYASESKWLLTDVLRKDWGYRGYTMSDWGGLHSTSKAMDAGLDQQSGFPFDDAPYFGEGLKAVIKNGGASEAQITKMAGNVLFSMFTQGLFEHPVAVQAIDFGTHAAVSQHVAEQGIVLLKNEANILPLSKKTKTILVVGGYADKGVLAGGGSSVVYPEGGNAAPNIGPTVWPGPVMYYPSSPLSEIRTLAPLTTVNFHGGFDQDTTAILARKNDVVIVFATQWAGESFDVPLALGGQQDQLITAVATANPNTIVVLETGGPVLMPWAHQVAGIIEAWYPGTAGATAIANVLFGEVNPSGHLPITFPRSLQQLPRPDAPVAGDTRYTEGATVGYKWFDAKNQQPLFAFGHGLSYTTFAYGDLKVHEAAGSITASWTVRNTGQRTGMATPQIYVDGKFKDGAKRLGGWQKLELKANESKRIEIRIDPRLLATVDASQDLWKIAAGEYRIMLASSATAIHEVATITLHGATLPTY